MTIWLIFPLFPPYVGGAAAQAAILAKGFAKERAIQKIIVLTEHLEGSWVERSDRVTVLRILPRRASLEEKNLVWYMFTYLITQIQVIGCVLLWTLLSSTKNKHIFHIHRRYAKKWFGLGVIGKIAGSQIVVDVQDHAFNPRHFLPFWRISYVSHEIGEKLKSFPGLDKNKLSFNQVPIDFDEIIALSKSEPHCPLPSGEYILFVGDVKRDKGVIELLTAFGNLKTHNSVEFTLVIAGPNHLEEEIEPELLKDVKMLGRVPKQDVYHLIKNARLLILPSKSEGLPRVCVEAMFLQTPVICPPGIRAFKDACPHSVLSEISVAAIEEMLLRPPESLLCDSYPFEDHQIDTIIQNMIRIYEY